MNISNTAYTAARGSLLATADILRFGLLSHRLGVAANNGALIKSTAQKLDRW